MTLSCDPSSSSFYIPRGASVELCLHGATLRVPLCSAASPAILNLAGVPSHDTNCAVSGILSVGFIGKTLFNTQ